MLKHLLLLALLVAVAWGSMPLYKPDGSVEKFLKEPGADVEDFQTQPPIADPQPEIVSPNPPQPERDDLAEHHLQDDGHIHHKSVDEEDDPDDYEHHKHCPRHKHHAHVKVTASQDKMEGNDAGAKDQDNDEECHHARDHFKNHDGEYSKHQGEVNSDFYKQHGDGNHHSYNHHYGYGFHRHGEHHHGEYKSEHHGHGGHHGHSGSRGEHGGYHGHHGEYHGQQGEYHSEHHGHGGHHGWHSGEHEGFRGGCGGRFHGHGGHFRFAHASMVVALSSVVIACSVISIVVTLVLFKKFQMRNQVRDVPTPLEPYFNRPYVAVPVNN